MTIKLIVGLGNPGEKYKYTRHNIGARYVSLLAKKYKSSLCKKSRFFGHVGTICINGCIVNLLIPDTYVNLSGISVFKFVSFYRLSINDVLVAHDDLDLFPGKAQIKFGGTLSNSHNGLKDIINRINNNSNFYKLRIGIGRPIAKNRVTNFVLEEPSLLHKNMIYSVIFEIIKNTESIIVKDFSKVMNRVRRRYSYLVKTF